MAASRTLESGLLWWQARHPDWPGDDAGWGPDVSSYAVVDGDAPVLIDPLAPPADLVTGERVVVVLTCAWHSRDAAALAAGGAEVYVPQRLEGVPAARTYDVGDALPGGLQAHAAFYPGECALWIPTHRALAVGESLYGVSGRPRTPPPEWLPDGVTLEELEARLAPLADLEPHWFLPTHGEPFAEAAGILRTVLAPSTLMAAE